jgi:glutathione reductase (NADPH)
VAIAAGRALSERLFNGKVEAKMDYNLVPTTIFSHPPIGTCGLSQEEAVAAHGEGNPYLFATIVPTSLQKMLKYSRRPLRTCISP